MALPALGAQQTLEVLQLAEGRLDEVHLLGQASHLVEDVALQRLPGAMPRGSVRVYHIIYIYIYIYTT